MFKDLVIHSSLPKTPPSASPRLSSTSSNLEKDDGHDYGRNDTDDDDNHDDDNDDDDYDDDDDGDDDDDDDDSDGNTC